LYTYILQTRLTRDTMLKDDQGNEFPAMKVFSESIAFIKRTLLQYLKTWKTDRESHKAITKKDIRWVLTVPAIWDEEAKQFMRKSAEEVGFQTNQSLFVVKGRLIILYQIGDDNYVVDLGKK